jgi:hypothetical protein
MVVFTDKVHWLCHAAWNFSVFSAFLSATLACKHTRFINNILLVKEYHVWDIKKWFHHGSKTCPAHPPLLVVLLLSGTEMFFKTSIIAYAIGLGIYLGCVWQQNLDSSRDDSRNIFIWCLVWGILCFCIYFSTMFAPRARESEDWDEFWDKGDRVVKNEDSLCLCCMRLQPGGGEICVNPDCPLHKDPADTSHTRAKHELPEREAAVMRSC